MKTRLVICTMLLALGAAAGASAQSGPTIGGLDPNNPVNQLTQPYEYLSDEGGFRITWPSGCGQLRRRETADDPDADPFEMVYVFGATCDQFGREGRGCGVTSITNLKGADGGPPGPPDVISRMEEQLKALSVNVVNQTPVEKALPDGSVIRGLDIRAKPPRGAGEVWLRGLLYQGRIFLLSAWNRDGGLWEDPEIQDFFGSFAPLVE